MSCKHFSNKIGVKAVFWGLLLSMFAVSVRAESVHLILLTEDNRPFNYVEPATGVLKGPSVDLLKLLMERARVSYEMKVLPWRRGYLAAQSQPNTCLFSTNRTEARTPLFKWVYPLYPEGGLIFLVRQNDRTEIGSISDLRGHVIISENAFSTIKDVEEIEALEVTTTKGEEKAYQLFMAGRGDFLLTGTLASRHILNTEERKRSVRQVLFWKKTILGLACSLDTSDQVIAKLNEINQTLGNERDAILGQYF